MTNSSKIGNYNPSDIIINPEHFPELAKLQPERLYQEISRLKSKGLTEDQAKVNLEQDLMEAKAMSGGYDKDDDE